MDKIDLKDVSFLIPLRVDTVSRLENILVVVEYLLQNFDTQVKVLEASNRDTGLLRRLLPREVDLRFQEDHDTVFHRTKYINELVDFCQTPFLSVWDTDIIIHPRQIEQTIGKLRNREVDFVTPYRDRFLDVSLILRDLYIDTRQIELLEMHQGKMQSLYNPNPVGGVFFANCKSYRESGMENEKFYGWGREDGDRFNRWKISGFSHIHVDGPLYHLSHERGVNSTFHSPNQNDIKMAVLHRSLAMSKEELKIEVENWRK